MRRITILNFPLYVETGTLNSNQRTSVRAFYERFHPHGDANYIDKHMHVDTNYVRSDGWERMK